MIKQRDKLGFVIFVLCMILVAVLIVLVPTFVNFVNDETIQYDFNNIGDLEETSILFVALSFSIILVIIVRSRKKN